MNTYTWNPLFCLYCKFLCRAFKGSPNGQTEELFMGFYWNNFLKLPGTVCFMCRIYVWKIAFPAFSTEYLSWLCPSLWRQSSHWLCLTMIWWDLMIWLVKHTLIWRIVSTAATELHVVSHFIMTSEWLLVSVITYIQPLTFTDIWRNENAQLHS